MTDVNVVPDGKGGYYLEVIGQAEERLRRALPKILAGGRQKAKKNGKRPRRRVASRTSRG